jgi:hypothetical protein
MSFATSTGRPPLSGRIDARTAGIIRKRYLTGASMAEIAAEIGETEGDIYRYVSPRRDRWKRDLDIEHQAKARGHIVVWRRFARKSGSFDLRPVTLPGTTIQRNMMAEAGR